MFGRKLKVTIGLILVLSFVGLAQNTWNVSASGGNFPAILQNSFFGFFFSESNIEKEQKADEENLAPLATRTWDGGGATNNWSEAANWSGDTVPTSSDTIVFDGTSTKDSVIDNNFTVI